MKQPCGGPSGFISRPHGPCGRGFSTLIRPALLPGQSEEARRARQSKSSHEAIRGKAAPRRLSGALLFRPFSWAMQEKGQGNRGRSGGGGSIYRTQFRCLRRIIQKKCNPCAGTSVTCTRSVQVSKKTCTKQQKLSPIFVDSDPSEVYN